jgi:hypothetical protein
VSLILVILGLGFGWASNWFYFLQGWFCDCNKSLLWKSWTNVEGFCVKCIKKIY